MQTALVPRALNGLPQARQAVLEEIVSRAPPAAR
jgi:hypothetical protein